MTLRPQFSLINSEFNEFLFASVGEEKNGMPLTVLSALTRLGLDPWGEAARLSDLPRETAERGLAAAIAGLPEGDWKASDSGVIAARLVDHLPQRSTPAAEPQQGSGGRDQKTKSAAAIWLVCAVLVATMVFAMSHRSVHHASEAAPSTVSAVEQ